VDTLGIKVKHSDLETKKDIIRYIFKDKVKLYPHYPYCRVTNKLGNFYIHLKYPNVFYFKVNHQMAVCIDQDIFSPFRDYVVYIKNKKFIIKMWDARMLSIIQYLLKDYKKDLGTNQYGEISIKLELWTDILNMRKQAYRRLREKL